MKNYQIAPYSFFERVLASVVLCSFAFAAPSSAQLAEHWDTKVRARSQNVHSAGIRWQTKGDLAKAIAFYREANKLDPTNPVPLASLGLGLAIQGRYKQALDALQLSYKYDKAEETLLSTGMVYYLEHDYDAAINAWNKILESNPKLCHINGDIGFAYLRKGDLDQAEQSFDRLVKCYPNSQFGFQGLALVSYMRGNFEEARKHAEQAEILYSYPPVVLLLAKLDFLQGDMSRGTMRVKEYNSLTRNKRKNVGRPMTYIGYPIQHDFKWDPFAEDDFDSGNMLLSRTQADPATPKKNEALARKAKAEQAVANVKAKLAKAPKDFYLLRELGLAELAKGDNSSAADAFNQVVQSCPPCNVDLLHLGRALSMDGKHSEASAAVREFQKVAPTQRISPVFNRISDVDPALSNKPMKTTPSEPLKRISPEEANSTMNQMPPQDDPGLKPAIRQETVTRPVQGTPQLPPPSMYPARDF